MILNGQVMIILHRVKRLRLRRRGAGITCAAMVIATLADKNVTPVTTAEWSKKRCYKAKGQGTYYSYFKPQGAAYSIEITMLNSTNIYGSPASKYHDLAKKAIENGDLVIACMGKGNWDNQWPLCSVVRLGRGKSANQ